MAGYRFLTYIPLWASITLNPREIIRVVYALCLSGLLPGVLRLPQRQVRFVTCYGLSASPLWHPVRSWCRHAKGFFSLRRLWFGDACEIVLKLSELLKETVTIMPGCFILKGKKTISDHILITRKHENSQISFPS